MEQGQVVLWLGTEGCVGEVGQVMLGLGTSGVRVGYKWMWGR